MFFRTVGRPIKSNFRHRAAMYGFVHFTFEQLICERVACPILWLQFCHIEFLSHIHCWERVGAGNQNKVRGNIYPRNIALPEI